MSERATTRCGNTLSRLTVISKKTTGVKSRVSNYRQKEILFVAFVMLYGTTDQTSAGIDQANPAFMPADDILGNQRDATPDIGAYESPSLFLIFADGFED